MMELLFVERGVPHARSERGEPRRNEGWFVLRFGEGRALRSRTR
jgi:hypothetical protein